MSEAFVAVVVFMAVAYFVYFLLITVTIDRLLHKKGNAMTGILLMVIAVFIGAAGVTLMRPLTDFQIVGFIAWNAAVVLNCIGVIKIWEDQDREE